jgi:L-aspartate oxidase
VAQVTSFDVVVVGGGLAGLSVALRLAETGVQVGVLLKRPATTSSSAWAQGGIAAALDPEDTPEEHIADTLVAGAGLCHPEIVRFVAESAPAAIRWLQDQGVAFTTVDDTPAGALHLTREGGHSRRRIVHAADATGRRSWRAWRPVWRSTRASRCWPTASPST